MDTFRLIAKDTHRLASEAGAFELRAPVMDRARLVCGEDVTRPITRALLRVRDRVARAPVFLFVTLEGVRRAPLSAKRKLCA